jgi:hypothetical protein
VWAKATCVGEDLRRRRSDGQYGSENAAQEREAGTGAKTGTGANRQQKSENAAQERQEGRVLALGRRGIRSYVCPVDNN